MPFLLAATLRGVAATARTVGAYMTGTRGGGSQHSPLAVCAVSLAAVVLPRVASTAWAALHAKQRSTAREQRPAAVPAPPPTRRPPTWASALQRLGGRPDYLESLAEKAWAQELGQHVDGLASIRPCCKLRLPSGVTQPLEVRGASAGVRHMK